MNRNEILRDEWACKDMRWTEKSEWSGRILMGFVSHARQAFGTLKLFCRVGRMGVLAGRVGGMMAEHGGASWRVSE